MTAPVKVPLSVWCDAATHRGLDLAHTSCPGNWDQPGPPGRPEWGPIQIYRCGCTCHTEEPA